MLNKSKLRAITPKAASPSKPKILIYGKPGVGKTWTALDFPSCYYIDTEGGADLAHYTDKLNASGGVYMGPDQGSLVFDEILGQVQALTTEKHPYKTLVIDSISKVFAVAIADEAERLEQGNKKNEFGADKKPAIKAMRRLTSWLTRLDMTVILIAHEKEEWGQNDKGERIQIGATFDAWDKLEYELHLALHIVKAGPKRVARVRKTRLQEFPDASSFPWSYAEFSERYGRDIIEQEAKQMALATPEQIAEWEQLVRAVNFPQESVQKWLKAGNAETFAELETGNASACIAALRKTIPTPKEGIS